MSDNDIYKKLEKIEDDLKNLKEQNNTLIEDNRKIRKNLIKIHKNFISSKNMNFCPICENELVAFAPYDKNHPYDLNRCPYCKSLHRQRLVYLVMTSRLNDLLNSNIKLLHFAPEPSLYDIFRNKNNIDYYPVDLKTEQYDRKNIYLRKIVNMEMIPYEDNAFDLIYNSHVLEHVSNDIQAMSELYRVLKPNGACVVMVPMSSRQKTLEKMEYNTPELRKKYYYQSYHLRLYGKDFKDRLASVGFDVEEVGAKDIVSLSDMAKYGLTPRDKVFIGRK